MRTRLLAGLGSAALALALTAAPASAAGPDHGHHKGRDQGYTFAVIGDTPYGAAKIARFPQDVAKINADQDVRLVIHVGDIKNGSTVCSDEYFRWVKGQFDRFEDPLVYTPGDNEWTDCHRANNGGYDPLERLATIRKTFFGQPGLTLGRSKLAVDAQTRIGFPENVRRQQAGVVVATTHVVGSDNSMAPWTGKTAPTPEQAAEVVDRTAAAVAEIHAAFAQARASRANAVVIAMQADMFDGSYDGWTLTDNTSFVPVIKALTEESNSFRGASYLFDGDSHVYNDDSPLAAGSVWLQRYGLTTPAPKLHRITVDGSDKADDYLKVTVNAKAHLGDQDVLSYVRVPLV
ncbi:metallophosphoesterase [Arsenicicoccus dermatophilus]|uniref:metallophosphoesterase n=1 Tax=Arsenicicoccus dermatophilus TaxID=1076331 RepID=UPI001F4D255D|nr:metallophosphoesterase [Arsenicicoccus dermatophilus]MCH8612941.1 hypothetical protein [Arsenicicoccus dermatophilus]